MPPKKPNSPGAECSFTDAEHKLIYAIFMNMANLQVELPRVAKFMGYSDDSTAAVRIQDFLDKVRQDALGIAKKEGQNPDKVFRHTAVTLPIVPTLASASKANARKRAREDQNPGDNDPVVDKRPKPDPSLSDISGPRKLSAPVGKLGLKTPNPYTTHSANAGLQTIAPAPIPNSNNVANQTTTMGMDMGINSFPSSQMLEAQGLSNGHGHGLHSGISPFGTGQVGDGPTFNVSAVQNPLAGPNDVGNGLQSARNMGTLGSGNNGPGINVPSMRRHPIRGNMSSQTAMNGTAMGRPPPNGTPYNPFMGNMSFHGNTLGLDAGCLDQTSYCTNQWNQISVGTFNPNLAVHNLHNPFLFPPESLVGNQRTPSSLNIAGPHVSQQVPTPAPTPQINVAQEQQQQQQLQTQQGQPQNTQLHRAQIYHAQLREALLNPARTRQLHLHQAARVRMSSTHQAQTQRVQQAQVQQAQAPAQQPVQQSLVHQAQVQQAQAQQPVQHALVQQELFQQELVQQELVQQAQVQQAHVQQDIVQQAQLHQPVQQEHVQQELDSQLTHEEQRQLVADLQLIKEDLGLVQC
ncbi:hypothetical protein B0T20DRAFT_396258 [Sordaria brevicollis]|uniref:Uncharacterized protein n=1 Tax=Sordaria brevicollis TaxID=83679 RepID=A0AAE0P3N0_SORBR|nr:hypothetical protein B0T20DRAFT_396258 [Sordaria brevicollis]